MLGLEDGGMNRLSSAFQVQSVKARSAWRRFRWFLDCGLMLLSFGICAFGLMFRTSKFPNKGAPYSETLAARDSRLFGL